MINDNLTLIVVTDDAKESWTKNFRYYDHSPRHDCQIDFIRASEVTEKAAELEQGTRIQISSRATVAELIAKARKCIAGYDRDYKVIEVRPDGAFGFKYKYHLSFPALSSEELERSFRLSDVGVKDGDLVLLSREWEPPEPPVLTLKGVSSFMNFQEMVWGSESAKDPMLLSVLLYTEEDFELARYVREHFDELHQMSGPRVLTYVVERPPYRSSYKEQLFNILYGVTRLKFFQRKPDPSVFDASAFWKERLNTTTFQAWSLLGWTQSKPYDKTAAYEIARKLGVYPDQMPCLAIFDKTEQEEKIVIPIGDDLTAFFRSTYSNLQRAIDLGPGRDIWDTEKLNKERQELFNKIRDTMTFVREENEEPYIVYNFYGQTVFINQPSGLVQLQDFQNAKQEDNQHA